jgi:hypothetical protein
MTSKPKNKTICRLNFILATLHLLPTAYLLQNTDYFASLYESMNIELPVITQWILATSQAPDFLVLCMALIFIYTGAGLRIMEKYHDSEELFPIILIASGIPMLAGVFIFLSLVMPMFVLISCH